MDPIFTALANIGGVGILAAALLLLHREALKQFREEMQIERAAHDAHITAERDQCHEDHEKLMAAVNKNTDRIDAVLNSKKR